MSELINNREHRKETLGHPVHTFLLENQALKDLMQNNIKPLLENAKKTLHQINEMIFKEENILFPMALETLTEDEWYRIAEESKEIGYCLTEPLAKWKPQTTSSYQQDKAEAIPKSTIEDQVISFESGVLSLTLLKSLKT